LLEESHNFVLRQQTQQFIEAEVSNRPDVELQKLYWSLRAKGFLGILEDNFERINHKQLSI
jgi:hypothetical protein